MRYLEKALENLLSEVAPHFEDEICTRTILEFDEVQEVEDYLEELVCEVEVIYYSRALEYLRENDPSLVESTQLARDMGFDGELNSELLATILKQNYCQREIYDIVDRIEPYLIWNK